MALSGLLPSFFTPALGVTGRLWSVIVATTGLLLYYFLIISIVNTVILLFGPAT